MKQKNQGKQNKRVLPRGIKIRRRIFGVTSLILAVLIASVPLPGRTQAAESTDAASVVETTVADARTDDADIQADATGTSVQHPVPVRDHRSGTNAVTKGEKYLFAETDSPGLHTETDGEEADYILLSDVERFAGVLYDGVSRMREETVIEGRYYAFSLALAEGATGEITVSDEETFRLSVTLPSDMEPEGDYALFLLSYDDGYFTTSQIEDIAIVATDEDNTAVQFDMRFLTKDNNPLTDGAAIYNLAVVYKENADTDKQNNTDSNNNTGSNDNTNTNTDSRDLYVANTLNADNTKVDDTIHYFTPSIQSGERWLFVRPLPETASIVDAVRNDERYGDNWTIVPLDIYYMDINDASQEARALHEITDATDFGDVTIYLSVPDGARNKTGLHVVSLKDGTLEIVKGAGTANEIDQTFFEIITDHFSEYAFVFLNQHKLTINRSPELEGLSTTGQGNYPPGAVASGISANSTRQDYRFDHWEEAGQDNITTNPHPEIVMNADHTLTAVFTQVSTSSTQQSASANNQQASSSNQQGTNANQQSTSQSQQSASSGQSGTSSGQSESSGQSGTSSNQSGTTAASSSVQSGTGQGGTNSYNGYDMPATGLSRVHVYRMIGVVLCTLFGIIELLSTFGGKSKRRIVPQH